MIGAPLLLLATLVTGLSALTLARSGALALNGLDSRFSGWFAMLYYGYASLAAVTMAMCLMWMVFARLADQLAQLATRDALTRVLNRAGLAEAVQHHFAGRQPVPPLSVLAIDIDHFKTVNDSHGHQTGDRLLCAVADTLRAQVRATDTVARTGGEEFVVCSALPPAAAAALAERLRVAIAAIALPLAAGAGTLRCTVSLGVSGPCRSGDGWDAALADADRALYAAKSAGRNRVVCAPGAPAPPAASSSCATTETAMTSGSLPASPASPIGH